MTVSPTAEGFRAAFRRPALSLAEITWRWCAGGTAVALALFGLLEYLNSLPLTGGELLFLRTRQPYLVAQAIAHILRGSLDRVVLATVVGGMMLAVLWMIAASVGRIATVRFLLEHFRREVARKLGTNVAEDNAADGTSAESYSPFPALVRLNFLRIAAALAAFFGFFGASILAGFISPDSHPRPGLAFLVFAPLAGLIALIWFLLNWLLSLSGIFAVRDDEDAVGAIAAATDFCGQRTGAVLAVSTWTGLAHLVAFVGATTVASVPLGLAGALPWRLVLAGIILVTLAYFALADWLYMARLAGYVCIAETPEALLKPPPSPAPLPRPAPPPLLTSIDRDEPILSDVAGLVPET